MNFVNFLAFNKVRSRPRWRKDYKDPRSIPDYILSSPSRSRIEAIARNCYPAQRIAITSMPRTSRARIYQLWLYR